MKKKNWKRVAIIFIVLGFVLWGISAFISPATILESSDYTFTGTLEDPIRVDNLIITSLDPADLDQQQSEVTMYYVVGSDSSGCYWIMQSVWNDRFPFTGFQIALGEHGTTTEPIYIGVMSDEYDPTNWDKWEVIGRLDPGVLPEKDTLYWVGLDLEDDPLQIGRRCYVLAISEDGPLNGNYWIWGVSTNEPYLRGTGMNWGGSGWTDVAMDTCFRTYTIEGPPSEPPDITITTTSQVVTQVLGSLSLLGALIAGTRYFMV